MYFKLYREHPSRISCSGRRRGGGGAPPIPPIYSPSSSSSAAVLGSTYHCLSHLLLPALPSLPFHCNRLPRSHPGPISVVEGRGVTDSHAGIRAPGGQRRRSPVEGAGSGPQRSRCLIKKPLFTTAVEGLAGAAARLGYLTCSPEEA